MKKKAVFALGNFGRISKRNVGGWRGNGSCTDSENQAF